MTVEELQEEINIEVELDWNRMREGSENIESVYGLFKERLLGYLKAIGDQGKKQRY
jgi:hypothetical protein